MAVVKLAVKPVVDPAVVKPVVDPVDLVVDLVAVKPVEAVAPMTASRLQIR